MGSGWTLASALPPPAVVVDISAMDITELYLKLTLRCRQDGLILDFLDLWPIHGSSSDKSPSGEAIPITDRQLR